MRIWEKNNIWVKLSHLNSSKVQLTETLCLGLVQSIHKNITVWNAQRGLMVESCQNVLFNWNLMIWLNSTI